MNRNQRRRQAQANAGRDHPHHRGMLLAGITIGLVITATIFAYRIYDDRDAASAPPATIVHDGSPSWSPDGASIVFYSDRAGRGDIYIMAADGGNVRRLTDTPSDEGYPSLSPDGQTITFDTDRDGGFDIYAMNSDGSNVRRITRHAARDVSASWSPDGRSLVFMSQRGAGFDAYTIGSDGTDERRLTTTESTWFPVYSPDGTRVAFHVERDIHVLDLATATMSQLTTDPLNGMYPSWSPDGEHIAFMSWRNGRTEIFIMNADGTNQQLIVSMPQGDAIDPRWSPTGDWIAFVHVPDGMNGTGPRTIWRVRPDGTALTQLTGR